MPKFEELFLTFALIGIVVFSMLSFIMFFQSQNDVSDPLLQTDVLNSTYKSLKNNLGNQSGAAATSRNIFMKENPSDSFLTVMITSIVNSGRVFNTMIFSSFNLLIELPVTVLGVDPVVTSVLTTILIFFIVMGLWLIYKLGG